MSDRTPTPPTHWTEKLVRVDQVRSWAAEGTIPVPWIVGALVMLFPVGLYFVWRKPQWATKTKLIWTAGWAAAFAVGMWLVAPLVICLTLLGTLAVALSAIWTSPTIPRDKKPLATGGAVGGFVLSLLVVFVFFSIRAYNAEKEDERKRYAELDVRDREKARSAPEPERDSGDQRVEAVKSPQTLLIGKWFKVDDAKNTYEFAAEGKLTSTFSDSTGFVYVRHGDFTWQGSGSVFCRFPNEPADQHRDYPITVAFSADGNVLTVDGRDKFKRADTSQTSEQPGVKVGAGTPDSFALPDGTRVTTRNATRVEKALGLLQPRMTPAQVEAVLGKADRTSTNRFGDKLWHYRAIGTDRTKVLVGFPGKGEFVGVVGLLIVDGKEMLSGKDDYRKQGGGVDVGDVTGW